MIISASYRTDIPAFYGDWFMNRLRAGYCKVINPYGGQVSRVSLMRDDVDGFVFWTKNLSPFADHLPEIRERGFPFVVQFGINGYPREFETSVIDPKASVTLLRRTCGTFGTRVCVWRYDTIVVSSLTPVEWHLRNFEALSRELQGATDEVVISFLHPYQKTIRALRQAATDHGLIWRDPAVEEKKDMASRMVAVAGQYGMRLSICAQRQYIVPGASDARCVDAERLSDVAGRAIYSARQGHRKECGCWESRDIGEYDTCPHGCVYCYAVSDPALAKRRLRTHDPQSEFLIQGSET
jgi:hypothetical protein